MKVVQFISVLSHYNLSLHQINLQILIYLVIVVQILSVVLHAKPKRRPPSPFNLQLQLQLQPPITSWSGHCLRKCRLSLDFHGSLLRQSLYSFFFYLWPYRSFIFIAFFFVNQLFLAVNCICPYISSCLGPSLLQRKLVATLQEEKQERHERHARHKQPNQQIRSSRPRNPNHPNHPRFDLYLGRPTISRSLL